MRKILLIMMCTYSFIALAETPTITLVQGWKGVPIVVNDSLSYFYSQEACPPKIIVLPRILCGEKQPLEINNQEYDIISAP